MSTERFRFTGTTQAITLEEDTFAFDVRRSLVAGEQDFVLLCEVQDYFGVPVSLFMRAGVSISFESDASLTLFSPRRIACEGGTGVETIIGIPPEPNDQFEELPNDAETGRDSSSEEEDDESDDDSFVGWKVSKPLNDEVNVELLSVNDAPVVLETTLPSMGSTDENGVWVAVAEEGGYNSPAEDEVDLSDNIAATVVGEGKDKQKWQDCDHILSDNSSQQPNPQHPPTPLVFDLNPPANLSTADKTSKRMEPYVRANRKERLTEQWKSVEPKVIKVLERHLGFWKTLTPRLFIILPETEKVFIGPSELATKRFRVHFLCECGGYTVGAKHLELLTTNHIDHQLHPTKPSYAIKDADRFFKRYGEFLKSLLCAIEYTIISNTEGFESGREFFVEGLIESIDYLETIPYQTFSKTTMRFDYEDLKNLPSYLDIPEGVDLHGGLFRTANNLNSGVVSWQCPDHSTYIKSKATSLHQVAVESGGQFDELRGRIKVFLQSKNVTQQLISAVTESNGLISLDVTLARTSETNFGVVDFLKELSACPVTSVRLRGCDQDRKTSTPAQLFSGFDSSSYTTQPIAQFGSFLFLLELKIDVLLNESIGKEVLSSMIAAMRKLQRLTLTADTKSCIWMLNEVAGTKKCRGLLLQFTQPGASCEVWFAVKLHRFTKNRFKDFDSILRILHSDIGLLHLPTIPKDVAEMIQTSKNSEILQPNFVANKISLSGFQSLLATSADVIQTMTLSVTQEDSCKLLQMVDKKTRQQQSGVMLTINCTDDGPRIRSQWKHGRISDLQCPFWFLEQFHDLGIDLACDLQIGLLDDSTEYAHLGADIPHESHLKSLKLGRWQHLSKGLIVAILTRSRHLQQIEFQDEDFLQLFNIIYESVSHHQCDVTVSFFDSFYKDFKDVSLRVTIPVGQHQQQRRFTSLARALNAFGPHISILYTHISIQVLGSLVREASFAGALFSNLVELEIGRRQRYNVRGRQVNDSDLANSSDLGNVIEGSPNLQQFHMPSTLQNSIAFWNAIVVARTSTQQSTALEVVFFVPGKPEHVWFRASLLARDQFQECVDFSQVLNSAIYVQSLELFGLNDEIVAKLAAGLPSGLHVHDLIIETHDWSTQSYDDLAQLFSRSTINTLSILCSENSSFLKALPWNSLQNLRLMYTLDTTAGTSVQFEGDVSTGLIANTLAQAGLKALIKGRQTFCESQQQQHSTLLFQSLAIRIYNNTNGGQNPILVDNIQGFLKLVSVRELSLTGQDMRDLSEVLRGIDFSRLVRLGLAGTNFITSTASKLLERIPSSDGCALMDICVPGYELQSWVEIGVVSSLKHRNIMMHGVDPKEPWFGIKQ